MKGRLTADESQCDMWTVLQNPGCLVPVRYHVCQDILHPLLPAHLRGQQEIHMSMLRSRLHLTGSCHGCALVILIGCSPASENWDLMAAQGTCIDLITLLVVSDSYNIATDFTLFLLPIPLIWILYMPWSKKLCILATFATGVLWVNRFNLFTFSLFPKNLSTAEPLQLLTRNLSICAIAIVRTAIVVSTLKDIDQSWSIIPEITWLYVVL